MDVSMGSPPLSFSWARMNANEQQGEDMVCGSSPHMWCPGSTAYPMSMPTYYPMSSRAEEIAKGRQELMQMLEGLPESTYELSLSDLVERKEALEKSDREMNAEQSDNSISADMEPQIKRPGVYRNGKKVDDTKQFLLNIFVPSSMTTRSTSKSRPIPTKNSCGESNGSTKQWGKGKSGKNCNHTSLATLFKPPYSSTESSPISSSKVSPKPYPAPVYQPLSHPSMDNSYDSKLSKKSNSSRCAKCCGYIFFFKATCKACGKFYCRSCVRVAIENTPEGPKCRENCVGQLHSGRYCVNKCLPFWTNNRRKAGYSLGNGEQGFKSP